jgi:hypothetical protein
MNDRTINGIAKRSELNIDLKAIEIQNKQSRLKAGETNRLKLERSPEGQAPERFGGIDRYSTKEEIGS